MLDSAHIWGVVIIQELQLRLKNYTGLMLFLSHIGDPKIAFNIYFPVAYFVHNSLGKRVLWAAVISEWLNSVAKWLLHGERPYWWVHNSGLYKDNVPNLQQFSITCETGPGSPSGHAMVTSAVWYILISDFLYYRQVQSFTVKFICWASYVIIMSAVCVSRLFIATHFPHQVIGGIFVGILLGKLMNSLSTSTLQLHHHILVAAILTLITGSTYLLIRCLGIDPFWSLALATKYCSLREWVHMDTSLFYCIVRDISSLIGLGVTVMFCHSKEMAARSSVVKIAQLMLALVIILSVETVKLSHNNIGLFYLAAFLKHSILTFVVAAGIPVFFNLILK